MQKKKKKKNRKQTSIAERLPAHKTRMRTCCIKSDIKETTTFNMHNKKNQTERQQKLPTSLEDETPHTHIPHSRDLTTSIEEAHKGT